MTKLSWPAIVERAAVIVDGYSSRVTLRQLHYRLVSEGAYPNTTTAYKRLSSLTAEARRQGTFPDLLDRARSIHLAPSWTSPRAGLDALTAQYRRDRTEGQEVALFLAVEKNGLVEQLTSWFYDYGVPVLALGGYASQSYVDQIRAHAEGQGRPAVLAYAGDYDPSGEDILRDFTERTRCFTDVERVALTAEQVQTYRLPPMPGKATDSRAAGFVARHGALVQVEVDALPPDVLRDLFTTAMHRWWNDGAYQAVLDQEREDKSLLVAAAEALAS